MDENFEKDVAPKTPAAGPVLNWNTILNIVSVSIQYLAVTVPTLQGQMSPNVFIASTIAIGLLNICWNTYKQSIINSLVDENRELKK